MPVTSRNAGWRVFASALVVWSLFATAQAGLIIGLGNSRTPIWAIATIFAAQALSWTTVTLAIGRIASAFGKSENRAARFLLHVVLLFCIAALDALVRRAVSSILIAPPSISFLRTMLYYADITALSYVLALWIVRVAEAREALITQARHELALRAQLGRARLSYLHAQLQPHFLFNALGTVSELIFESPAAAIRTFRQLMAVLRAAASRDASEIPLREEIDALTPYLEVQRTRFSDWLAIDLEIEPAASGLLVPPLVLQPLVENSIRHGLRARSSRGRISITARVDGKHLVLSVRDNGAGLDPSRSLRRGGVGLSNTEERLRTLYGDDGKLTLFTDQSGGTVAEVSFPARRGAPSQHTEEFRSPTTAPQRKPGFTERHPAYALALGCIAASFLWTQQSYAYLALSGRLEDRSPFDLARDDFFMVAMWAAIVPITVWISRRVPFSGRRLAVATLLHAASLIALGALHSVFAAMWRNGGDPSGWLNTFRGSMPVTLLIYLAALAWSQRRLLENWLAARQVAALRINSEITEARIAAASLSITPESLDATLHALEQHAATNPMEAERIIAQLGTELRARLETASMDWTADSTSGAGGSPFREDGVERFAMGA